MTPLTREAQDVLVARIRDGDAAAWGELYTSAAVRLRRALLCLSSPDGIDDLVQDTLVRAYEKLHLFAGEASFTTWCVSVGRNIALMGIRQNVRERGVIVGSTDDTVEGDSGSFLATEHGYDDRSIEQREAARLIDEGLVQIRPDQATAIRMQLDGYSLEEIAATMRLSLPAVKSHVGRGKAALAKALGAQPAPAVHVPPQSLSQWAGW